MRKLIPIFLIFSLISCSKLLNEPKNLVPKDKMSQIIAELAISDQLSYVNNPGNMETQTRYILKKYGTTGTAFTESYKYYLSTKDLYEIFDDAQDIIKDKDPKAEDYIKDKLKKQSKDVPNFAK